MNTIIKILMLLSALSNTGVSGPVEIVKNKIEEGNKVAIVENSKQDVMPSVENKISENTSIKNKAVNQTSETISQSTTTKEVSKDKENNNIKDTVYSSSFEKIPFKTEFINSRTLKVGETRIIKEGQYGKLKINVKQLIGEDNLVKDTIVLEEIVEIKPINEVIEIGIKQIDETKNEVNENGEENIQEQTLTTTNEVNKN